MPIYILAFILIVFALLTRGKLLAADNLSNIVNQSIPYFICGLGMLFVAAIGGTDITCGSLIGLAGALAGMGAALLYLTGYEQWQCSTSSVPAMGFNGIAAAFLGGLNPLGTVLASFFIQHITAGGAYVDKSLYCAQISDLISSIIIYLCGFVLFMKYAMNASIAKREEKAIQRAKAAEADGKGGDQ